MAIIKPFKALRPKAAFAEDASCVPYDVIYTSEVREFMKDNPNSFLKVTRAEAEFEDENSVTPAEIFARARKNLEKFISEEMFFQENEPCFYIYQLATHGHKQTGLIGCCSIDEYESGVIKKHEKTRPDKVQDRTEHMLALSAQTGLIFLAFRNTDKIRALIHKAVENPPLYDFLCLDDVKQTVWRISDTETWAEAFAEVPNLYIADGHHRAESSSLARKQLREGNPEHTGNEDYNFVVAGMYPAEDLKILPYNRVVKDLNGLTREEYLEQVSRFFSVEDAHSKEPEKHGEYCMYLEGKWFKLTHEISAEEAADPIERLDVSLLQKILLGPVLGIGDARTDDRIGFVGGARGTEELERLVDENIAEVAFSLFPTTMDDLLDVSDIGEVMPPKSTWFEPKLKDGLLVHMI